MVKDNLERIDMRNYGIDLLRLVSMFYIVILHAIGRGGLLGRHLYLSYFLETWTYCGVNIFALISGYVGFRETDGYRIKFSRYFSLWLQVVLYGLLMACAYRVLYPSEITGEYFLKALFPVSTSEYWYFTAYTGVFFVAPIINHAVQSMETKEVKKSFYVLFILFCVYASCCSAVKDIFIFNEGRSFVWLAIMYYLGAAMRKTGILSKLRVCRGWIWIVILVFISELFMIITVKMHGDNPLLLIQNFSPTIVAIAVLHVVVFSRIKLGDLLKRIVKFAAPGSFAVYLLNTNPCFWNYSLHDHFSFLIGKPLYLMPVIVIAFAIIFVMFSVSIDFLRQKLFKMMRINEVGVGLEKCIRKKLEK